MLLAVLDGASAYPPTVGTKNRLSRNFRHFRRLARRWLSRAAVSSSVAIPHGTESEMPNVFQSKEILAESMLLKGDRLADMK